VPARPGRGKGGVWNTKATKGRERRERRERRAGQAPFRGFRGGFVSFVVQSSARDPAAPGGPEWGRDSKRKAGREAGFAMHRGLEPPIASYWAERDAAVCGHT